MICFPKSLKTKCYCISWWQAQTILFQKWFPNCESDYWGGIAESNTGALPIYYTAVIAFYVHMCSLYVPQVAFICTEIVPKAFNKHIILLIPKSLLTAACKTQKSNFKSLSLCFWILFSFSSHVHAVPCPLFSFSHSHNCFCLIMRVSYLFYQTFLFFSFVSSVSVTLKLVLNEFAECVRVFN